MQNTEADVSEQDLWEKCPQVLHALLKDHTRTAYETDRAKESSIQPSKDQWNIIWATRCYEHLGEGFGERDEISEEKVTGMYRKIIMPRALKDKDTQRQRSKDKAEVFTPCWVCNAQNNLVDDAWFGRSGVFNTEYVGSDGKPDWKATEGKIEFPESPSRTAVRCWWNYVKDTRLEITCGEAPYLVSRYDSVTGETVFDLNRRVGLLDRKLRVVSEQVDESGTWLNWAHKAVKSTYGFEWQGDNLLLAREAVLFTVNDYYRAKFNRDMPMKSWMSFAYIISWNLWQMDGLTCEIPLVRSHAIVQPDLFAEADSAVSSVSAKTSVVKQQGIQYTVCDWVAKERNEKDRSKYVIPFKNLISHT